MRDREQADPGAVTGPAYQQTKIFTRPFILMWVVNFTLFISFQMLLPTLPAYASSLHADEIQIGILAGALTIASILMRPISGRLLDTVGRKPILLIGLIVFGIFTFIYGFIVSVGLLILVRLLHGFSWGLSATGSNTVAADLIPKERFGEGIGVFTLSTSLAMAFGPALGLTILSTFNFQAVSIVSAAIVGLAVILSVRVPIDNVLEQPASEPETESFIESVFVKSAIKPSIIMALITTSLGTTNGFIAIYAGQLGIENVSFYFVIFALSMLVSRPLAGKGLDRHGPSVVLIPGLLLTILSLLVLSQAQSMIHIALTGVLYGAGFGSVQTTLQAIAVRGVAPHKRGSATSTFFIGFDLGIGIGAMFGGVIASAFGYSRMYAVLAGMAALSLGLYLVFLKRMPRSSRHPRQS